MRALALALVFLTACSTALTQREVRRIGGERTFYYDNGTVAARGYHAALENYDFVEAERNGESLPRWREFLRIGEWRYRYRNNRNMAIITYEVDWYTECCSGGPCDTPYETRSGQFEAWWPNGQTMAQGVFETKWVPIDTNCEGGDKLRKGVVGKGTLYWAEDGSPADATVLERAELDLEEL